MNTAQEGDPSGVGLWCGVGPSCIYLPAACRSHNFIHINIIIVLKRGRVQRVIVAYKRRILSKVLVIGGCWQLNHGDYGDVDVCSHHEANQETRERQKLENHPSLNCI
ncbi:hypothetical protein J6590_093838 [Homalodisca vitripennis]|nr:hypothetical protein J6590_093838 [Homalodisca vitripennis]